MKKLIQIILVFIVLGNFNIVFGETYTDNLADYSKMFAKTDDLKIALDSVGTLQNIHLLQKTKNTVQSFTYKADENIMFSDFKVSIIGIDSWGKRMAELEAYASEDNIEWTKLTLNRATPVSVGSSGDYWKSTDVSNASLLPEQTKYVKFEIPIILFGNGSTAVDGECWISSIYNVELTKVGLGNVKDIKVDNKSLIDFYPSIYDYTMQMRDLSLITKDNIQVTNEDGNTTEITINNSDKKQVLVTIVSKTPENRMKTYTITINKAPKQIPEFSNQKIVGIDNLPISRIPEAGIVKVCGDITNTTDYDLPLKIVAVMYRVVGNREEMLNYQILDESIPVNKILHYSFGLLTPSKVDHLKIKVFAFDNVIDKETVATLYKQIEYNFGGVQ